MTDETINVNLMKDDEVCQTKEFDWPQDYKDIFEDIITQFNLKKKKSKVTLLLVTEDEDEVAIKSQNDLDKYKNQLKEFKVYVEEEEPIKKKQSVSISKQKSDEENEEVEKNDDAPQEGEGGEPAEGEEGGEIEDLDPDELKKYIEQNTKIEDIKIDLDDDFFNDDYEKKLKEQAENQITKFKNNYENNINSKLEKKKEDLQNDLNLQLSSLVKGCLQSQKDAYNTLDNFKEAFEKIQETTNELLVGIKDYKEIINTGQLPIFMKKDPNQIKLDLSKVVPNQQMANFMNPNPLNEFNLINNNKIEEEKEEDDIQGIEFVQKKINYNIEKKESGFFTIEHIEIKNITKTKIYKNLYFARDNNLSSIDINFKDNTSKDKDIFPDITLHGDLIPKPIAKDKSIDEDKSIANDLSVTMGIQNAQPGHDYKIVLYIREKKDGKNISDALEVNVHVNQIEDPNKNLEQQINNIYSQLKKEFNDLDNIATENEVKQQIKVNNNDIIKVKNWIQSKAQEYQEHQRNQQIESIYNGLAAEIGDMNMEKNEIIDIIKNENFDIERIKTRINKKKAEDIYNKLKDECDFDEKNYNEIISKIMELNFNEDEIKDQYKKEEQRGDDNKYNNVGGGDAAAGGEDDEEINKMYEELDEEYGISGFKDEDEVKDKIRELNLNREAIVKWIEESLLNN